MDKYSFVTLEVFMMELRERCARYNKLARVLEDKFKGVLKTTIALKPSFTISDGKVKLHIEQYEEIELPLPFNYVIEDTSLLATSTSTEGVYDMWLEMSINGGEVKAPIFTLSISEDDKVTVVMCSC